MHLSFGQEVSYQVEKISKEFGLAHSVVKRIYQDKHGILWFGTGDGLNRYDGYEMVSFKNINKDTLSLSDNLINCFFEDSKNNLWIGTRNGLNKFDRGKLIFYRYFANKTKHNCISGNNISALSEDPQGNIWVGTSGNGISIMNTKTNHFEYITENTPKHSISSNYITDIKHSRDGNAWISTLRGLNRYSSKEASIEIIMQNSENLNGLTDNYIQRLFLDKEGLIWIGTLFGLNSYNNQTKSYKNYFFDLIDPSGYNTYSILAINQDAKGKLWIGTGANGMVILDPKAEDYNKILAIPNDIHGLSSNSINDVFIDRNQTVWIGTVKGGLSVINPNKRFFNIIHKHENQYLSFESNNITSVTIDSKNNIWAGIDQKGVSLINLESHTDELKKFDTKNSYNVYGKIIEDKNSFIWILNWNNQLIKFDPKSKKSKIFSHDTGIKGFAPRDFMIDSQGNIWIATIDNGITIIDEEGDPLRNFAHYPQDPNSIASNQIWCVYQDIKGVIWVGTEDQGLCQYDSNKDIFYNIKKNVGSKNGINNNSIRSILRLGDILWLGTSGGGINKYNLKTGSFKYFTEAEGLCNNNINSLVYDQDYNIWASTDHGLAKVDLLSDKITNFYTSDGLISNEFNLNAAGLAPNGFLFFGCIEGLVYFHPDSLKKFDCVANAYFTELKINNQIVKPGEVIDNKIVIANSLNYEKVIHLSTKHGSISIGFSCDNYINSNNNLFKYKLEGFDDDWQTTHSKNRLATYTNLPDGKYTFKVMASGSADKWDGSMAVIEIQVIPVFFKSLLFRIILWGSILILLVYFYLKRLRDIKRNNELLEIQVAIRTNELEDKNQKITRQNEQISIQNQMLVEQKKLIEEQNFVLIKNNTELERKIKQRTFELEEAKFKAEDSDRMKTIFLTNISHEIRTPMNAILGFSELLAEEMPADQKHEFIAIIKHSGNTLLQLIEDIIELSNIESSTVRINKSNCLLDPILTELFNYNQEIISKDKKKVQLILTKPTDAEKIRVFTDPFRLRQILLNLVGNAIKYAEVGTVEFGYSIENHQIIFFVKDSGSGLADDKIEAVYHKLYKNINQETRLYKGFELGLSITKNLVSMLGGNIRIESKLGKGSVFNFSLPYIVKEEKLSSFREEKFQWPGKTILIVEDDENSLLLIKAFLQHSNAILISAKNGQEAIQQVKTNRIDIILMDIMMPVMDGLEACKRIKHLNHRIPVLAITVYAIHNEKDKIYKAGFDDILLKPIDPELLLEHISQFMEKGIH